MLCPVCKENLDHISHEGQSLHRCIGCEGLLVSTDAFKELQRENDRHLVTLLTTPEKTKLRKAAGPYKCPTCHGTMKCADFAWNARIEIHTCEKCSHIWLDKGELAIIHDYIKREQPELIVNEIEYDSKKFFTWMKVLLNKAGEISPKVG